MCIRDRPLTEALPSVRMNVGGIRRRVLNVAITTCGQAMGCEGTGVVQLRPHGKGPIEPLGYDLILGMNDIEVLGGVTVTGGRCVRFGLDGPGVCAAAEAGISIRGKDFTATKAEDESVRRNADRGVKSGHNTIAGRRINPRAAAVAEATRSWTGARLCGDCGSRRGANDRRCSSCHGPPGNKTNVVLRPRTDPSVSKRQPCKSLDPAPGKWKRGSLEAEEVWQRVGMDITHVRRRLYLTLIDCGPSRFVVWRRLRVHCSANVTEQLEAVFYEGGAPEELLTDNDTTFRGRTFTKFIGRWGVRVRYRCAYAPSGNGIAERCHRSVKVIAARKNCTVEEAVYLYNVTPRDGRNPWAAPANVGMHMPLGCGVWTEQQKNPKKRTDGSLSATRYGSEPDVTPDTRKAP
ncbi:hypothetical protein T4E_4277 [Trichinella pseudospiralis]|uniref:Integrase catalytic domain-containing protein n=1 Tax=Trichinella pseudospiralis TaxID=6337 RepID=A0A0V0Y1R5_TRIPS|nr:hypothetical protein T4E_4277 [Trichinella pseudospiralis]